MSLQESIYAKRKIIYTGFAVKTNMPYEGYFQHGVFCNVSYAFFSSLLKISTFNTLGVLFYIHRCMQVYTILNGKVIWSQFTV